MKSGLAQTFLQFFSSFYSIKDKHTAMPDLESHNMLKRSLSLICASSLFALLWQLPTQGKPSKHPLSTHPSSIHSPLLSRPSESSSTAHEQRRIIIESSASYQFTDSINGIEHRGESQSVRIRRGSPLNSVPLTGEPQANTEAVVSDYINNKPVSALAETNK